MLRYSDWDPRDICILEECFDTKGENEGKISLKELRDIFENEWIETLWKF